MSALKLQIMEDVKTAMRAHDAVRLTTLRTLLSEIKNFEIDNGEQDDAGVEKVVAKVVKQTNESIVEYGKGGRQDLVAEEQVKLKILQVYLPKQLSDEELKAIVEEVLAAHPGQTSQGPLTGLVMKQVAGAADGRRVAAMIQQVVNK